MARTATLSDKTSPNSRTRKQPARRESGVRPRQTFLPAELKILLQRGVRKVSGLALGCLAILFLLALASYAPSDPSWNTESISPAQNLIGIAGSWTSDAVLQTIGLGGYVVVLAMFAWAIRLLRGLTLDAFRWRLLFLSFALLFFGAAFADILGDQGWPVHAGAGGVVGRTLLLAMLAMLGSVGLGSLQFLAGAAAFVLGIVFILPVLGLTLNEWRRIGTVLTWPLSFLFRRKEALASRVERPNRETRDLFPAAEISEDSMSTVAKRADVRAARKERKRQEKEAKKARKAEEKTAAARSAERAAAKAGSDETDTRSASKIVAKKAGLPQEGGQARDAKQPRLDLDPGKYKTPPLSLLQEARTDVGNSLDEAALEQNARYLETVLAQHRAKGRIVKVRPGPVVTLYELEPAPGVKSSRVINLAGDIAMAMSALSARVAVVPGRNVIGIELPNQNRETVFLREMMSAHSFERSSHKLALALGKDIGGSPVLADLAKMPHLLIAGTTGSGKSVAVNTMILSLLYRLPPDRCKFIMIDPKMLELSIYDGIPQLLTPVVTDPKKAVVALRWAVREMESRYQAMSKTGVRNIDGYNQRLADARKNKEILTESVQIGTDENGRPITEDRPIPLDPLPYIVVIVDEMADLMLVAGKDIEGAVQRLAQMARAAGIHLIMATQRPSVDVITGTIKANFPTRISFQVTTRIDSRTILGEQGAEHLLGQGDMLYMAGGGRITRVHGPFVSDEEVEEVVAFLRQQGEPTYIDQITEEEEDGSLFGGDSESGGDDMYTKAVEIVMTEGKCSTSFIQRRLQIGYNRAARIVEQMEQRGVVSAANHAGKREVLIGC